MNQEFNIETKSNLLNIDITKSNLFNLDII